MEGAKTTTILVNKSKTEFNTISSNTEDWKQTRKLGSLLDTNEDIEKKKLLATIAFKKMYIIWIRRSKIQEERLIRLYNTLIIPILTYNCGTWATTKEKFQILDAFHRKELTSLLDIKWTEKVTNEELYERTRSHNLYLLK